MTKLRMTTSKQFMPKILGAILRSKIKCPVCHEKVENFWLYRFHLPNHYTWDGKLKK